MEDKNERRIPFPLRLPRTTRVQAAELARREGISLNRFIVQAVAEAITRLEFCISQRDSKMAEEHRQVEA